MKYEQVYEAMIKLNEVKETLGLGEIDIKEGKCLKGYASELEMMIDKNIDILQFHLRTRATELQLEGLTSTKVNPINSINNLLNTIDESFKNIDNDEK